MQLTVVDEGEAWYGELSGDTAYDKLVDFQSKHLKRIRICGRSNITKKKMRLGAPASVRTHEIALCALCVGNELFCTLAPDANIGGFCVLLQSRKALRSCCNLAKLYVPIAISQSFTFRTGFLSNSCPNATRYIVH